MTYIFDTNALIDLKNSDINKILSMIKKGQIYSVEEVFREISKIDDTLKQTWEIIDNKYNFFIDISQKDDASKYWNVLTKLSKFNTFQEYGINKETWADPFIIATAIVDNATIVTNQNKINNTRNKFQYVCKELNVQYIDFNEFIMCKGMEIENSLLKKKI